MTRVRVTHHSRATGQAPGTRRCRPCWFHMGKPPRSTRINKLSLLAQDLRMRAEDVSTRAEAMRNAECRESMRRIAADYEELAQRFEREAGPDN